MLMSIRGVATISCFRLLKGSIRAVFRDLSGFRVEVDRFRAEGLQV